MKFSSLKKRMEYYRSLSDYRLTPNSYVIAMVDGHSFSKMIKKKYNLPFDDIFINYMDETAKYVCSKIQGCKFAYTQSDEISFLITDFDTPETDAFFSYRLCKLQSLIASYTTAYYNKLTLSDMVKLSDEKDAGKVIDEYEPVTFDCKAWTVPSYNDAYAWFLYRQNDCLRNSKQQTARTYLSHSNTYKLTADQQIAKVLEVEGVDWNSFDNGKKYGRIIYKKQNSDNGRKEWVIEDTERFNTYRHIIKRLIPKNYDEANDVFVVSSTFIDNNVEYHGVNAVCKTEERAKKVCDFLKEHPLEEDVAYTKETKIDNFIILNDD